MQARHAAVTGAAGAIGNDCAQTLLAEGWQVFGLAIREIEPITVGRNDSPGKPTPLYYDVSDSASVENVFMEIARHTQRINALICYLLRNDWTYMTGALVALDGGKSAVRT